MAIGNPEGLEGTVYLCHQRHQILWQQATPADHCTNIALAVAVALFSTLPVEWSGVAVGTFLEGQNLNFAVPVSYLKSLMATRGSGISSGSPDISAACAPDHSERQRSPYRRSARCRTRSGRTPRTPTAATPAACIFFEECSPADRDECPVHFCGLLWSGREADRQRARVLRKAHRTKPCRFPGYPEMGNKLPVLRTLRTQSASTRLRLRFALLTSQCSAHESAVS